MSDAEAAYRCIERLSSRVERFAQNVLEAQRLGAGPGDFGPPWTLRFQRAAVEVCFETLSQRYQATVGAVFNRGAELMRATPGAEVGAEWELVCSYLSSASEAIAEECERRGVPPVTSGGCDLSTRPPSVIRFDLLGELALPEGMAQLSAAAATVGQFCGAKLVDVNDQERSWVTALAHGATVAEVAVAHSMSNRSMYRALNQLWSKLEVDNRAQGVAVAAQMGLIDDDRDGPESSV